MPLAHSYHLHNPHPPPPCTAPQTSLTTPPLTLPSLHHPSPSLHYTTPHPPFTIPPLTLSSLHHPHTAPTTPPLTLSSLHRPSHCPHYTTPSHCPHCTTPQPPFTTQPLTLPPTLHLHPSRAGITSVFNVQQRGEHPHCGPGLDPSSGFTYPTELFMQRKSEYSHQTHTDIH